MIHRFPIIFIFSIVLPVCGIAQEIDLRMNVDIASFRYDKSSSYVELYYSFPRTALAYQSQDGMFSGAAVIHTIIRSEDEEQDPVLKNWRVPVVVDDTTGMTDRTLIGRVHFLLEPGRYKFAVITRDEARPTVRDSLEILYQVRDFSGRTTNFSDIELASSIKKAEGDEENIFYKNTLEVVPNPTLLYGKQLPNLLYYAELYTAQHEHFVVKSEIVSSYGKTMVSNGYQRKGKMDSRVEVGSLNLGPLPTGVYTLILAYGDTTGAFSASQSKSFYVYNPDIPLDTLEATSIADLIAAEFSAMGEAELDVQFAMSRYIATGNEQEIWNSLDGSESKRKFMTKFWRDRDPDMQTPVNEYYDEYHQRIAVCNEQFRTAFREGWRSDRGRVYMLYGPPDYVERRTSESDMKPHEIWRYDYIEGGVEFIFVDRGGFNSYELVHSTKRNEVYNPDWERSASTY
ncbi:MAG: GWxTD domain-containing protein [Bacteroidetes bacterium]|nr:GWxTD domain-containing protein [Bacteroidota bacterium]